MGAAFRVRRPNLRPAAIAAYLAIAGRVIVAPLLWIIFLARSQYLTSGKMLIGADDSYFAFMEMDPVMQSGCVNCNIGCRKVFVKFAHFQRTRLLSKPEYESLFPPESYDFSMLNDEALAVADAIDANPTSTCMSGIDELSSRVTMVAGTPQEVLDVVRVLGLDVAPQVLRETQNAVKGVADCYTRWVLDTHSRVFRYIAVTGSTEFFTIPAADVSIFPEFTECRGEVPTDDLIGERLAVETHGADLMATVPHIVRRFPYSLKSSVVQVTTQVAAHNTQYPSKVVTQQMLRAYYGGCRVRTVNTTGIYVEDSCALNRHWLNYGLMIQTADDLPVCSTSDVCVRNYYNSLWEYVTLIDPSTPDHFPMAVNSFRLRYADPVELSILPGVVILQMLLMGWVSLYQTMSHKRSVLLTQIWAYRCQTGSMQVLYLGQVTYHLVYNSDVYYLGLTTGTLSVESIGNLTVCYYAFSYSLINLLKARSAEQHLDRYFRLTWEILQLGTTALVGSALYQFRRVSLSLIMVENGELLRKTTARGAAICDLSDSCIDFNVNLVVLVLAITLALAVIPFSIELGFRCVKWRRHMMTTAIHPVTVLDIVPTPANVDNSSARSRSRSSKSSRHRSSRHRSSLLSSFMSFYARGGIGRTGELTSFERSCLGASFTRLFRDCGDFAYTESADRQRCASVEAVLLAGFVYYGEHVYQAQSVLLLLLARLLPQAFVRTFNVLLIRWHLDAATSVVSYPQACTWYTASAENNKFSTAVPIR